MTWTWDPKDGVDGWQLVTNNAWNCEDDPDNSGKSDFLLEVRDDKPWIFGAERAVASPWAQGSDVWIAELP